MLAVATFSSIFKSDLIKLKLIDVIDRINRLKM